MQEQPSSKEILIVKGAFEAFTPDELFDYFTKPDLLVQWWPQQAEVDPRIGGKYEMVWIDQAWRLSGEYTVFQPGKRLAFTWLWDHDRNKYEPLTVDLAFEPVESGGSQLTIRHYPWGEDEASQTEREGVREGWIHFGMRLALLRPGNAT